MTEEKKKRNRRLKDTPGPFAFKSRISARTADIIPSAQYACAENCPIAESCKYFQKTESCGVIDRYISDLENELCKQLEYPLAASYALILSNILRLAASLVWADIMFYYQGTVRVLQDDDTMQ